ncbi:RNA polymerase sigma-70 factor, ECF subfamily [Pedobacter sp. ok626]|uniref:RNA polymerase sigma-70 factor n=1 Tax=Pedobacter sp. ok626 TaxID=1761882 RepID=UPI00088AA9D2|nr:RNA polymerase sigma-70 factor [Pedobacter sp. ok626]SDK01635.1 RNA polymerase sigma-70 factor, ECF subfamily [Pedobacter sp. ok626]
MISYDSLSEQELVVLLRAHDHAAFTEIYKRFWDKIYVVACHRLDNELEAEEVVQDVFFSVWKRKESLEIQHSLNTYLSAAVKYQIINRQTRQYRKAAEISAHVYAISSEEGVDSTQLWFSEKELKQQLDHHIDKLPEKCRIIFKMSRKSYKSNAEIAKELGVSEKNVEAHITRAINTLKNKLEIGIPLILYLLKK